MIGKLLKLLGVVVLIVVILCVAALFWIDELVEAGLTKGASYALEVETSVDEVDLSLLGGTLAVSGMKIGNPEGFDTSHFMKMANFNVAVEPMSVFRDTIILDTLEIDGLDLNIEQKLTGSNVAKLIESLKRFESDDEKEPAEVEAEGKKVRLNVVRITNVTANFHLLSAVEVTVPIKELELTDITSEDSGGLVMSQLMARLAPAIIAAVLEEAEEAGTVPGGFLKDLDGRLDELAEALGGDVGDLLKRVQKDVGGDGLPGDLIERGRDLLPGLRRDEDKND